MVDSVLLQSSSFLGFSYLEIMGQGSERFKFNIGVFSGVGFHLFNFKILKFFNLQRFNEVN